MNRDQQLADIRKACIEANPKKKWSTYHDDVFQWYEPCRLADVLLALSKVKKPHALFVGSSGGFYWWNRDDLRDTHVSWKPHADEITLQSDETIAFLASLLPHSPHHEE